MTKIALAITRAEIELREALRKYPEPFHSPHEGYAVLQEEVHELWLEVMQRQKNMFRLRTEAAHVAAMALRFMIDCTPDLADEQPLAKANQLYDWITASKSRDEMEAML